MLEQRQPDRPNALLIKPHQCFTSTDALIVPMLGSIVETKHEIAATRSSWARGC